MLSDIYNVLLAVTRIRRQRLGSSGIDLFFAYARLRAKNRWFNWTRQNRTFETFLGFKINFLSYSSFVYLVEEIFVHGLYSFNSNQHEPVVLDCGSNIGLSIMYFKNRYPDARVIGFEPDKKTFEILVENIRVNQLRNVELHNVALSDREGTVNFHTEKTGSLSASIYSSRTDGEKVPVEVPCRPLSNLIDRRIDFLKMDIEGAEGLCLPEVARSGRLTNIEEMVIECHHNIAADRTILTKVLSVLEANRFCYQVSSFVSLPLVKNMTQDVILYAYKQGSPCR